MRGLPARLHVGLRRGETLAFSPGHQHRLATTASFEGFLSSIFRPLQVGPHIDSTTLSLMGVSDLLTPLLKKLTLSTDEQTAQADEQRRQT